MQIIELIEKWFKKACSDLRTAFHMFYDIYPKEIEITCYHCQQAVEKVLKAYLLYHDIEPPYIHDLGALCKLCSEYDDKFIPLYTDCQKLTIYASMTRYPNNIEITEEETKIVLKKTYEIYNFVYGLIPGLDNDLRFPEEIK